MLIDCNRLAVHSVYIIVIILAHGRLLHIFLSLYKICDMMLVCIELAL